jgi:hypothetical protein
MSIIKKDRLGRSSGIITDPIGCMMFLNQYFIGRDIMDNWPEMGEQILATREL